MEQIIKIVELQHFDNFINNILCRRDLNQENAQNILNNNIIPLIGINNNFLNDLRLEMNHYLNENTTTEAFGLYLKEKKYEYEQLLDKI